MAKSRDSAHNAFFRPLVRLCKPLVRFALARGLRYQEMLEVLKAACVEVAAEDLDSKGLDVNPSRLSVLTGLQRKEISKLRSESNTPIGNPNLLNRIIGLWQSDKRFLDARGKSRPLRFEGAESEFAELVTAVSADVNPYTVLFGLEQSGAVRKEGGILSLATPVYDASKSVIEGLELLALDSSNLHRAVEQNLFAGAKIPNLHISTVYDNVSLDSLEKLRSWILDKGSSFHEEAREFIAKYDKDANPRLFDKQGGGKVAVCTFSFIQSEESHD